MIWKAFGRGAERLRYFIVSCFKWGWRTAGRLLRAGWHLALDWGGRLWSGLSWCIRHGTQIAFACARIVWNCMAGFSLQLYVQQPVSELFLVWVCWQCCWLKGILWLEYPGAFGAECKSVFCSRTGTELYMAKENIQKSFGNGNKRNGAQPV